MKEENETAADAETLASSDPDALHRTKRQKIANVKDEEEMPENPALKSQAAVTPNKSLYHCDYCGVDLSNVMRIRCAECEDFDLCLDCFSVGAEVKGHRNYHAYMVKDRMTFPIFSEHWSADEELLLLEGIELYGFGNWIEISMQVGEKTPKQCQQHFISVYLRSSRKLLPDIGKTLIKESVEAAIPIPEADRSHAPPSEPKPTGRIQTKPSVLANEKGWGCRPSFPLSREHRDGPFTMGDMAGWMPFRGDFEYEHLNDAELLIADMTFGVDDTDEEREIKYRVLESYCMKLDERKERKEFLFSRGLIDPKRMNGSDKKRSREEKDMFLRLRCFMRFLSPAEHEELVQGVCASLLLKERIAHLQWCRENGLRTLAECDVFTDAYHKRQMELTQLRKAKDSSQSYVYPNDVRSSFPASRPGGRNAARDKAIIPIGLENAPPAGPSSRQPSSAYVGTLAGRSSASGVLTNLKAKPVPLVEIHASPGSELLSSAERDICVQMKLLPLNYLSIKNTLIRECLRHGYMKKRSARHLVKIDVNKTSQLYDFFVSQGWIWPTSKQVPASGGNPSSPTSGNGGAGHSGAGASSMMTPGNDTTGSDAAARMSDGSNVYSGSTTRMTSSFTLSASGGGAAVVTPRRTDEEGSSKK